MPPQPRYRFGAFELRPDEGQLLHAGVPVPATARALAVLAVLLEQPGRLVTRELLMSRVWAGLVVEDNNLAVQIAVLRKRVGASAIATVPGRGYRFEQDVQVLDQPAPAPREGGAPRHNLPARLPPLIGRDSELASLDALLQAQPLVTLCGPAGIGKSRLAQALARQRREAHADGAYWVELAPLSSGVLLPSAIAQVLGLNLRDETEPAALVRSLKAMDLLLVLDNAEHLVADVARVADLLHRHTSGVTLLVTSQVPLHVAGEQVVRLGPLALPAAGDRPDTVRACGAVPLLIERARAAGAAADWNDEALQLAGQLCRALDGNALAIELAAARMPALGLANLVDRLDQRLQLLSPARHRATDRNQALLAALDWSYGLLSPDEQRVFRRLGVFAGGFELDLAALCVADAALPAADAATLVLDLVDRSLVSADASSAGRHQLLETGRLYALDRLQAAGELDDAQRCLAHTMLLVADDAYDGYWRIGGPAWRAQYEPELDNLRAALAWATVHDTALAVALFGSCWPLWNALSISHEARALAETLIPRLASHWPKRVLARFWEAVLHHFSNNFPQRARAAAQTAAQLYADEGLAMGRYVALVEFAFNWRVDHPEARRAMAEALAIESPDWPPAVLERGRTTEAMLHTSAGDQAAARALFERARELSLRRGYARGVILADLNLADQALAAGLVDEAVQRGQALRRQMALAPPSCEQVTALGNLAMALLCRQQAAEAHEVLLECRAVARRVDPDGQWCVLDAVAWMLAQSGDLAAAARLAGASDAAYRRHGQHQRQPNEARARACVAALLEGQWPDDRLAALQAEGEQLGVHDAMRAALGT
ncbi:MAG: winged helix-turn-helix domain-containing protein [Burkholderiaceae bacterium]